MYEKNAKVNFVDLDYQTNIISIEYLLPYSVCFLYYRIALFRHTSIKVRMAMYFWLFSR